MEKSAPKYPELTMEEFLLLVTNMTPSFSDPSPETYNEAREQLAKMCLIQGMVEARKAVDSGEIKVEDRVGAHLRTIEEAHKRWITASDYIRDTSDIPNVDVPSDGYFIAFLGTIVAEGDQPDLENAMIKYLDKAQSEAAKSLMFEKAHDVSEEISGDEKEMTLECLRLLQSLGTFHMDRSAYATDDEKNIHDRIVTICRKLTGS